MRLITLALLLATCLPAQHDPSWSRPFPAHRIADNLFYVGTEDLACFLVTTPAGHILINTGLADSTPLISASIAKVGYRLEDVKILLTMQAHFDHVAAMAEVQRITRANVFASEADAPILEDGGKSDPWFGKTPDERFAPVKVDRRLQDGDPIRLGNVELTFLSTPGHSKGSATYVMKSADRGRPVTIAIANMETVVMPLKGNPKYPGIASDFAASFKKQKSLAPDIWVAAHSSQYRMKDKVKAGSFVDPQGYKDAVAQLERVFLAKLAHR